MEESGGRGRRRKEVNVASDTAGSQEATGDQGYQYPPSVQRELIIQREIVRWCAVILTLLFLLLAVRTTDRALQYYSDVNETSCNNLTQERDHLYANYNNLALEKDQLYMKYNTMTMERDQLQSEVNQLKRERADKSCPSGWQRFGCSCYYRVKEAKSWDESRGQCLKTPGADLVIINSKEEQDFIRGLNTVDQFGSWLGLKRTEGKWTWVDGTPLTTQYWSNGWPRGDEDLNCAGYEHSDGGWINLLCSIKPYSICEKYLNFNDESAA